MKLQARIETIVDQLNELACQQQWHCSMADLPGDNDRMEIADKTKSMLGEWQQDQRSVALANYDSPSEVSGLLSRYSSELANLNEAENRMMYMKARRALRLN